MQTGQIGWHHPEKPILYRRKRFGFVKELNMTSAGDFGKQQVRSAPIHFFNHGAAQRVRVFPADRGRRQSGASV